MSTQEDLLHLHIVTEYIPYILQTIEKQNKIHSLSPPINQQMNQSANRSIN